MLSFPRLTIAARTGSPASAADVRPAAHALLNKSAKHARKGALPRPLRTL